MSSRRRRVIGRRQRLPGPLHLEKIDIKLKIPLIGEISGVWEPDQVEREAAWELYVELITRVTVVELADDEGLLREALTSLHSVFGTTREILRRYGPALAPRGRKSAITFGGLAVVVLNGVLRPVLAKWHPALAAWESQRPPGTDPGSWEKEWKRETELRQELAKVRASLGDLAKILADVAGAEYLLPEAYLPPSAAGSPATT